MNRKAGGHWHCQQDLQRLHGYTRMHESTIIELPQGLHPDRRSPPEFEFVVQTSCRESRGLQATREVFGLRCEALRHWKHFDLLPLSC